MLESAYAGLELTRRHVTVEKSRALSHRLEDGARRLADRAALATLMTNLRRDG